MKFPELKELPTQELVDRLTAERAALAAQVEQLREALKTYAEIEIAEGEGVNVAQNALSKTPAQCLAERDAGKFNDGYNHCLNTIVKLGIIDAASGYYNQLRQQAKEQK